MMPSMTPSERNIVKSLIAVAWADGKLEQPESGVIEGLLCGFDASEDEEAELLEYARTPRTLEADIPLDQMSEDDRELLLANAALLAKADGEASVSEQALLSRLSGILGFAPERSREIIESAGDGALNLSSRSLEADE
jgi:tellurite resistance protein